MQEGIVIVGEVHTNAPHHAGVSGFHGEPYLFVGNAHVYGDWRKCKLDPTTLVSGLKVRVVVVAHPRYKDAYQAVEDENGVPLIRRLTDKELTILDNTKQECPIEHDEIKSSLSPWMGRRNPHESQMSSRSLV